MYIYDMFEQCLYFNTTALARQLENEWSRAFLPFGLTPPQAFMLRVVLSRPGLMQYELANALTISRPTATRALDALKSKAYVERRASENDGRLQAIFPTASAIEIHESLNQASIQVGKRLKKVLGTDVFSETVSKIRDASSALK